MYKKFILFIVFFVFSLTACENNDYPYVDLSKRQQIPQVSQKWSYTYAYLPQYSHLVSFKRQHLLVEYLKQATNLPIRQIFPDSFSDHMKMFGEGSLDISYSNPFVYVKLAHRYGAKAIARVVEKSGKAEFRGQIIARKDHPQIKTIQDLRGKSWIAVDPSSAGGYLFVLGYLQDHGLGLKDFSQISFATGAGGKQEQVVLNVYLGKYDFGSIREGTLEVLQNDIDISKIKVLANTPWYPGWVFALRPNLPEEDAQKIKKALLSLDIHNPDQAPILKNAGFIKIIPAKDEDYDPIRKLCKKLKINLDE
ncbi:MAG: hypothetical protein PWR24_1713 [Desulfonauticus sp.]|jgi:phosphonate transport system substrate-binding protein|nr:MAG: Phosphonate ABC transporter, periplasmic phosphonate-binding protein [Desulfonauticus sp. 38_4375]MDK2922156.1 hypothetical protein [Desulfonauticus sp.]